MEHRFRHAFRQFRSHNIRGLLRLPVQCGQQIAIALDVFPIDASSETGKVEQNRVYLSHRALGLRLCERVPDLVGRGFLVKLQAAPILQQDQGCDGVRSVAGENAGPGMAR